MGRARSNVEQDSFDPSKLSLPDHNNRGRMKHLFRSNLILAVLAITEMAHEPSVWARDRAVAEEVKEAAAPEIDEPWDIHFQATVVSQWHPGFSVKYSGPNSISARPEFRTSLTSTLFAGARLWHGAEFYVHPELVAGNGFSHTTGVAGFPNGEIYRVSESIPTVFLARLFLRQTFDLGGEHEKIESDQNQLAGTYDNRRITLTLGKFSLTDLFDDNVYSHDPRTQFLNWSIIDNGAWDYAADTRGYTWGIAIEYQQPQWALRLATVMVPLQANKESLDFALSRAHGDNAEFDYRYAVQEHPGKTTLSAYANHAHMGSYRETIDTPAFGMNITLSRKYRVKYGFGLNIEQELSRDVGVFLRLGWNDGRTETWAFTEIDRTASFGISLKGALWKRPEDTAGIAVAINGLSGDHADYLKAGGVGFIIGDGRLTYAPEQIVETYYLWMLLRRVGITADTQFINHPAYNADRGPVYVAGVRLHYEF